MPYMNPIKWFRTSMRSKDHQKGFDHVDRDTVVESDELEELDFTAINVRPITYAEASEQLMPAANSRIVIAEAYSNIDESKLAVQLTEEYEQQQSLKPRASVHVYANIEYGQYGIYEFARSRRRSHKGQREHRHAKTGYHVDARSVSP